MVSEEDVTLLMWSHECLVGVQAMDDQHGILMETLNDLRLMLFNGTDRRRISLQLERLIEFTQMHFQSEEELLKKQAFPDTESHSIAHQQLISRLYAALEQVNRVEPVALNSIFEFLPSWYLDHVEKLDRPYGTWLNDHGVF